MVAVLTKVRWKGVLVFGMEKRSFDTRIDTNNLNFDTMLTILI